MENKLTNEEISRVFLMYWQSKFVYEGSLGITRTVMGITRGWNIIDDTDDGYSYRTDKCKLLLTPLSAITDEHAIEAAIVHFKTNEVANSSRNWVKHILESIITQFDVCSFLISKQYAVPLWFGIDHWANGKTAIELGIAIDKTKME